MTFIDKLKLTIITILTFGFIWIWLNKKTKIKNELKKINKVNINLKKLLEFIDIQNIIQVTNTQNKVKIIIKKIQNVKKDNIKKISGISGVMFTSSSITLIVGKTANAIKKEIEKYIK